VGIAVFVHSWPGLALGLAGSGLGAALCQLSANRLLVLRTADHRLGVGFGMKQAAVPSASLLAGFTVAALGMGVSWRTTYLAAALVAMTLSAVAPKARTRMSARPRPDKITAAERAPLLRLALAGAAAGAAGNSLALLAVDAFEEGGFSETSAALILGVGSAAALGVRVLAGWVVDRRRTSGHPQLVTLLVAGTVGFIVLATAPNRALLVAGAMVAFAAGWGWNGLLYFAATRSAGTRPATATGLVMSGVGAGTIFGPLLVAFTADHAGYGVAWGVAAGLIAAGAVLAGVAGARFRTASEA
jgi:MFS family permease